MKGKSMDNAKMTETLPLVGVVSPQLIDNNSANTSIIDFKLMRKASFFLLVGAIDTTVDFKLQAGNASDLSDAADITGKAVTQYADTDDNKHCIVHLSASEMAALGKRYARGVVAVGNGTTGGYVAVAVVGDELRYSDAGENDLAAVKQIVP